MKNPTQSKNRWYKIWCFLLVGIIFISTSLQAQKNYTQKERDSLENVLNNKNLPDDELYATYQSLIKAYVFVNIEKSLEYAWKGMRLAQKRKHHFKLAEYYYNIGIVYFYLSKRDSTLYYYEQALVVSNRCVSNKEVDKEDLEWLQMHLLIGIASIYYDAGKYNLALDNFLKALNMAEKIDEPYIVEEIYKNIAETYLSMMNFQQAEVYLLKSEKICREMDDTISLSRVWSELTHIYIQKKDYPKAFEHAEKAYRILLDVPDVQAYYLSHALGVLSNAYYNMLDYDKAFEYALKAVEYSEQSKIPHDIASNLNQLSRCYLKQKRYREAEETAFRALATDSTQMDTKLQAFQNIAEANIRLKNSEKAIEYFIKTLNIQADYSNQHFQISLSEMEVKYETEKKEHEIERQQNIIARHSMYRWILTGCVVISVLIIALFVVLLRLRKRHNRILTEMNSTKDKFFSIISHDLKNPAIAQRDAIQQLIQNANQWNNDELTKYYNDLLKSANEGVELLYTLLSWAQIQTGRMSYTPVTFDLSAHLRTDLSLIRKMAEYKKMTFTDQIPNHVTVTGDINMLVTVVRNLLTNAVKFTPVGGEILLTIEPTPNGKHIVSVSDTGTGMSSEQIDNLFSIDNRHSRHGTLGEQGSGLGLIVCKEMLEKHKSVLHVESEEGKGSRFWFEI